MKEEVSSQQLVSFWAELLSFQALLQLFSSIKITKYKNKLIINKTIIILLSFALVFSLEVQVRQWVELLF